MSASSAGRAEVLEKAVGDSPFRDASAMLETLARLEEDNRALRREIEQLSHEVGALRDARGVNATAFLRRLTQERDDLAEEVKTLRERTHKQDAELIRWRKMSAIERLLGVRPGK